jgi:hypothetical protein
VDSSWSFGIDVTKRISIVARVEKTKVEIPWETPWNAESGYKVLETGVVAGVFREKSP